MTVVQATWRMVLGTVAMSCALFAPGLVPPAAAATLNPPPPTGSSCKSTAHGSVCHARFPFTVPAFDTGLACPGFAVLESDSGTKEFSGYYDGAGNATEWVIHFNQNSSDPGNRLINAMTGRSVPFDEHFTATLTQFDAASGTFGILTQTGLALRVSAPGQGLILLDVGKLVLDLNTGAVIELHGRYDTFSGHTQKLCAALT